jgi:hypothetical protein
LTPSKVKVRKASKLHASASRAILDDVAKAEGIEGIEGVKKPFKQYFLGTLALSRWRCRAGAVALTHKRMLFFFIRHYMPFVSYSIDITMMCILRVPDCTYTRDDIIDGMH